jgi:hypothetical protein
MMNAMNKMTKNEGPALSEVKSSELQAITGGHGYSYDCPDLLDHLLVRTVYKPWLQFQLGEPHPKAPPQKG